MAVIEKRTWPEFFQPMLDGKKNCDVRLADFPLEEGDTILFREWEPSINNYTGRTLTRKVKHLTKMKFSKYNSRADLDMYGQYVIELEKV